MSALVPVTFRAREVPLPPVAVAAVGPHAAALRARACALSDAALHRFTGVTSRDVTVLIGPPDLLPWFDGALFLGATGALWTPTWAEPQAHPVLLERALRQKFPAAPPGPLAVLLRSLHDVAPRVVPLGQARTLSRARLAP